MLARKMELAEAVGVLQAIIPGLRQVRSDPDWARYAEIYDDTTGELLPYQELIESVVDAAELDAGMTIVDAATGTGNLIAQAIAGLPDLTVHGFEYEANMLDIARSKFGMLSDVQLHQADLNRADWVDQVGEGQADVVFSVNTLYILKDRPSFLHDVRRALKLGGKVVLSNPVQEDLKPIILRHVMLGGKITDFMLEMFEINLDIGTQVETGAYRFSPAEELRDWLADASLVIDATNPPKPAYADVNTTIVAYAV